MVPTQGLDGAELGGGLKEMLKGPIGTATMPRYKAEQGEWWKEAGPGSLALGEGWTEVSSESCGKDTDISEDSAAGLRTRVLL